MVKTKKRKREIPLQITAGNMISDEDLAISAFEWEEKTPTDLWQAVFDDDILAFYNFCKTNSIVPETLQIGTKHVWELAFQYGSWRICIWIILRIQIRFPDEEKIKLSRLVAEMDECALEKFARVWTVNCPEAFSATIFCSPDSFDKWQRVMNRAGKRMVKTENDTFIL
jgi:hypothetical protein